MILSGEDILCHFLSLALFQTSGVTYARRPSDLGTESSQSLNQHRGLDGPKEKQNKVQISAGSYNGPTCEDIRQYELP